MSDNTKPGSQGDALELSRYINAIMQVALTPDQLKEVNEWNKANPEWACKSHDMIDANIVAYGAFASMFFREMDCASELDCSLMNAAVKISIANGYGVKS